MKLKIAAVLTLCFVSVLATQVTGQPVINVIPDSLDVYLFTGEMAVETLTVSNTGSGDLVFDISIEETSRSTASGATNNTWRFLEDFTTSNIRPQTLEMSQRLSGEHDETPISPTSARGVNPDSSILVIQNTAAWGIDMYSFILDNFGIAATVINSSQIASTDFSPFDIVLTVGDENSTYYSNISSYQSKFESFVSDGGVVQYQLATQGNNVSIVDGVNIVHGNQENVNRVLLPDHPIVAGLDTLLQGNSANHCYLTNLPTGTQIITVTNNTSLPTTVEYSFGSGSVIATGMTWEFLYNYGYNSGPMLYNALAYSLSVASVSWVLANPASGTVPAGSSLDIEVTFDATGLNGGDYFANILISSNDASKPEDTVSAHLQVTGAPDMSVVPDSLAYGSLFIGASATDTVIVKNIGTDLLVVSDVSSNHADFVPDVTNFSLTPGSEIKIAVTFTPSTEAIIAGLLTITSNDPDMPVETVVLEGQGLVPPIITVSPDSMDVNLFSGETVVETLTVSNTGYSDLNFDLRVENTGARSATARSLGVSRDLEAVPLAELSQGEPMFTNETMSEDFDWLPATGPTQDGNSASIVPLPFFESFEDGNYDGWTEDFGVGLREVTNATSAHGLYSFHYQNSTTGHYHGIHQEFDSASHVQPENVSFYVRSGSTTLYDAYFVLEGDIGTGIFFFARSSGFFYVNGNQDFSYNANQWYHVEFREIDWTNKNFDYYVDGSLIRADISFNTSVNQFSALYLYNYNVSEAWWDGISVGGVSWLFADPSSGTIPAGSSLDIEVTFDATGLNGGDYQVNIILESNDPLTPSLSVPAHLFVTGIPVISVSDTSLDLGSEFLGVPNADTLTITNIGTDPLIVSSISTDNIEYISDISSLSLDPGVSQDIVITYLRTTLGLTTSTLTIVSNDTANPLVTVALQGESLDPPIISAAPDSIDADLFTGDTLTRVVTITNSGGSDLLLDLSFDLSNRSMTANSSTSTALLLKKIEQYSEILNDETLKVEALSSAQSSHHNNVRDTLLADPVPAGFYTGDYLAFGITNYGEIMPFQSPVGNEHLMLGTYLSGYTLVYNYSGQDYVAWAAQYGRVGIVPVSYTELTNTSTKVIVEVVTVTSDGFLTITRKFTFDRLDKYVNIITEIENVSPNLLTDIVFKSYADWDLDGSVGGDNWDYDLSRNMIYVWDFTYTTIATSRTPDLMDIYGWDDYRRRLTNVDYPTGPVNGLDGLEILHFEFGNLVSGGGITLETVYAVGSDLPELQDVVDRGLGLVDWLGSSENSAIIPAGTSQDFDIIFDANGLNGGDYYASVLFNSNDPVNPKISVAAHLHVTGAPDILVSPDSIDFGALFISFSQVDSVKIENKGTDTLHVLGITSNNSDFVPGTTIFSLLPGENIQIPVTFTPSVAGPISGILTITSNDPISPVVTVGLEGQGLTPPVIGIDVDSLDEHLFIGDTTTRTFTISNTGGSDLNFDISLSGFSVPSPAAIAAANSRNAMDAAPLATFEIAKTLQDLINLSSDITYEELVDAGTMGEKSQRLEAMASSNGVAAKILVLSTTNVDGSVLQILVNLGEAYDYIVTSNYYGIDFSPYDILIVATDGSAIDAGEVQLLANAVQSGKKLLIIGGTNYSPYYNGLQTYLLSHTGQTGWVISSTPHLQITNPSHPLAANLPSIYDYNNTGAGYYMLRINDPMASVIALNGDGHPVLVSKKIGSGELVYFTSSPFYFWWNSPSDYDILQTVIENSLKYLGASWLRSDISAGTIPAGGSQTVTLTFDARELVGGDYFGSIAIISNDSLQSQISIPVHLGVTGIPDIALEPDSLDFDSLFIGLSKVDSFVVTNVGTDILTISSIVPGNSHFTTDQAAGFALAIDEEKTVQVTFLAGTDGDLSTVLTINSDDPDESVIIFPVKGKGLIPPEISATPTSFSADLLLTVNPIESDTFTIYNTGGSDLTWSARFRRAANVEDNMLYTLSSPYVGDPIYLPDEDTAYSGLIPAARTEPVQVYLGDLTDIQIMFDISHNQNLSSSWSIIISDLENRGATVTENFLTISDAILADVEVFWLTDGNNWSPAEITALHNWVNAGGGLLIEADQSISQYNFILSALGTGITYSATNGNPGLTNNIFPHVTTTDINTLWIGFPGASLSPLASPARTLVEDINGVANTAYSKVGKGLVVAMSDENFFNFVVGTADNQLFANQMFDWLSGAAVSWLAVEPNFGTIKVGQNKEVIVTIDGTLLETGEHAANIFLDSNDPVTPKFELLVEINVLEFICGDANGNGVVDQIDLDHLFQTYFYSGPQSIPVKSTDLNCNNIVDLADILFLARILNGDMTINCCY